jgi:hypothetical protein
MSIFGDVLEDEEIAHEMTKRRMDKFNNKLTRIQCLVIKLNIEVNTQSVPMGIKDLIKEIDTILKEEVK